jgi:hypothetical protein
LAKRKEAMKKRDEMEKMEALQAERKKEAELEKAEKKRQLAEWKLEVAKAAKAAEMIKARLKEMEKEEAEERCPKRKAEDCQSMQSKKSTTEGTNEKKTSDLGEEEAEDLDAESDLDPTAQNKRLKEKGVFHDTKPLFEKLPDLKTLDQEQENRDRMDHLLEEQKNLRQKERTAKKETSGKGKGKGRGRGRGRKAKEAEDVKEDDAVAEDAEPELDYEMDAVDKDMRMERDLGLVDGDKPAKAAKKKRKTGDAEGKDKPLESGQSAPSDVKPKRRRLKDKDNKQQETKNHEAAKEQEPKKEEDTKKEEKAESKDKTEETLGSWGSMGSVLWHSRVFSSIKWRLAKDSKTHGPCNHGTQRFSIQKQLTNNLDRSPSDMQFDR